jgi:hypothetical protein
MIPMSRLRLIAPGSPDEDIPLRRGTISVYNHPAGEADMLFVPAGTPHSYEMVESGLGTYVIVSST